MLFYVPEKRYSLQVRKSYLYPLFFQICLFLKLILIEDWLKGWESWWKDLKEEDIIGNFSTYKIKC